MALSFLSLEEVSNAIAKYDGAEEDWVKELVRKFLASGLLAVLHCQDDVSRQHEIFSEIYKVCVDVARIEDGREAIYIKPWDPVHVGSGADCDVFRCVRVEDDKGRVNIQLTVQYVMREDVGKVHEQFLLYAWLGRFLALAYPDVMLRTSISHSRQLYAGYLKPIEPTNDVTGNQLLTALAHFVERVLRIQSTVCFGDMKPDNLGWDYDLSGQPCIKHYDAAEDARGTNPDILDDITPAQAECLANIAELCRKRIRLLSCIGITPIRDKICDIIHFSPRSFPVGFHKLTDKMPGDPRWAIPYFVYRTFESNLDALPMFALDACMQGSIFMAVLRQAYYRFGQQFGLDEQALSSVQLGEDQIDHFHTQFIPTLLRLFSHCQRKKTDELIITQSEQEHLLRHNALFSLFATAFYLNKKHQLANDDSSHLFSQLMGACISALIGGSYPLVWPVLDNIQSAQLSLVEVSSSVNPELLVRAELKSSASNRDDVLLNVAEAKPCSPSFPRSSIWNAAIKYKMTLGVAAAMLMIMYYFRSHYMEAEVTDSFCAASIGTCSAPSY